MTNPLKVSNPIITQANLKSYDDYHEMENSMNTLRYSDFTVVWLIKQTSRGQYKHPMLLLDIDTPHAIGGKKIQPNQLQTLRSD